MYTKNSFDKYPVFKNIIKKYGLNNLLDPLTKCILRGHIMTYVDELIREKVPFSLIIIDIDNFKQINDNYGHQQGDVILKETCKSIIETVGDAGLVGRYGGDEFIIVDLVHTNYDSMHAFLTSMYNFNPVDTCGKLCQGPFRRDLRVNQLQIFITGTIGSANFPNDATDYDDLFNKADKALYRGKMKGRNCFIIYVHEKHKDIDITKLVKEPLQNIFHHIDMIYETKKSLRTKFVESAKYIEEKMKISGCHLFDENGKLYGVEGVEIPNIADLVDEIGFTAYNLTNDIYDISDELNNYIDKYKLFSLLIGKIIFKNHEYGYLVFNDSKVQRIWQNEDMALLVFYMQILGMEFYLQKK